MKAFELEKNCVLLVLLFWVRGNLLDDDVVGVDEYCFVTHNKFFVFGPELFVFSSRNQDVCIAYVKLVWPHRQELLLPGFVLTKLDEVEPELTASFVIQHVKLLFFWVENNLLNLLNLIQFIEVNLALSAHIVPNSISL